MALVGFMLAISMYTLGVLTAEHWFALSGFLKKRWREHQQRTRGQTNLRVFVGAFIEEIRENAKAKRDRARVNRR